MENLRNPTNQWIEQNFNYIIDMRKIIINFLSQEYDTQDLYSPEFFNELCIFIFNCSSKKPLNTFDEMRQEYKNDFYNFLNIRNGTKE